MANPERVLSIVIDRQRPRRERLNAAWRLRDSLPSPGGASTEFTDEELLGAIELFAKALPTDPEHQFFMTLVDILLRQAGHMQSPVLAGGIERLMLSDQFPVAAITISKSAYYAADHPALIPLVRGPLLMVIRLNVPEPSELPITRRGLAFRCLARIDPETARQLNDPEARAECITILKHWMKDPSRSRWDGLLTELQRVEEWS